MASRRAHHQAAGGEGLKARAHGLQADLLPGVGERSGQPVGALRALAQQVEDLKVYVRLSIVGVHSTIMPVWRLREALILREARGKGQKSPSERHLGTPALAPYRAPYTLVMGLSGSGSRSPTAPCQPFRRAGLPANI
jgi:hypothetical protein